MFKLLAALRRGGQYQPQKVPARHCERSEAIHEPGAQRRYLHRNGTFRAPR